MSQMPAIRNPVHNYSLPPNREEERPSLEGARGASVSVIGSWASRDFIHDTLNNLVEYNQSANRHLWVLVAILGLSYLHLGLRGVGS